MGWLVVLCLLASVALAAVARHTVRWRYQIAFVALIMAIIVAPIVATHVISESHHRQMAIALIFCILGALVAAMASVPPRTQLPDDQMF